MAQATPTAAKTSRSSSYSSTMGSSLLTPPHAAAAAAAAAVVAAQAASTGGGGGANSAVLRTTPVLIFPVKMTFYSEDPSSFKQYVTLYNPYDWPLRFKLLCTSAKLYDVRPPKGVLRPQSSLDIVVRIKDFGSPHKDRFLLQILDDDDNTVNEKPIAVSVMLGTPVVVTNQQQQQQQQQQQHYTAGATGSRVYTDKDHELSPSTPTSNSRSSRAEGARSAGGGGGVQIRAVVFILLSVVLALSTTVPTSQFVLIQSLAGYVTLPQWQQLLGAFILGMITMSFLNDL